MVKGYNQEYNPVMLLVYKLGDVSLGYPKSQGVENILILKSILSSASIHGNPQKNLLHPPLLKK